MQRRINQLVEVQQTSEGILDKTQFFQEKMKKLFDKRVKIHAFQLGDSVLKWETIVQEKGKHGKFDHIWQSPYKIFALSGKKAYFFSNLDGRHVGFGPINGRFLKHYIS